jgi:hypothetical protein
MALGGGIMGVWCGQGFGGIALMLMNGWVVGWVGELMNELMVRWVFVSWINE